MRSARKGWPIDWGPFRQCNEDSRLLNHCEQKIMNIWVKRYNGCDTGAWTKQLIPAPGKLNHDAEMDLFLAPALSAFGSNLDRLPQ